MNRFSRYPVTLARCGAWLGRRLISERAWVCVKVGNTVLIDGVPFLVTKALQGGRGRGASFVKSTIKNRYTGKSMDKTFNSEDPLEIPDVAQYSVEYSWKDDSVDEYVFMDNKTFEEVRVPSHVVSKPKFLVPGQKFSIAKYKDAIIDLVFPHTGEFTVASVDEQVKLGKGYAGTLDTGAVISIPPTIKAGTKIIVNITDEEFMSRA